MSDTTYIKEKRTCDICWYVEGTAGIEASYDARTNDGQWANVCEGHFQSHTPGVLGTGRAQKLVVGEAPPRDRKAEVTAAAESGDIEAFFDAIGDGDITDYL